MVISRRRFLENEKKCTEIIKAREGREKVFFLFIKYAKFVALILNSLLSRTLKTKSNRIRKHRKGLSR